eukprot:5962310-Pleurochrysis_carterae.AAC.8
MQWVVRTCVQRLFIGQPFIHICEHIMLPPAGEGCVSRAVEQPGRSPRERMKLTPRTKPLT